MTLKTETNTRTMERRVLRAFRDSAFNLSCSRMQADFEHGQWWLTCLACGAQYSVQDAEGGAAVDGFIFEQVSEGDAE